VQHPGAPHRPESAFVQGLARGEIMATTIESDQRLHLVFGGELENLDGIRFRDVKGLDIVGIYPDYASAQAAWRAKAQATVDSAQTRYFVVHLHRLLEPQPA
jgi:hypothetical protein